MKNFVKATILLAFLSFGGWALTAKPVVYRQENLPNQTDQKQAARVLYLQNCARCHGADGKSQSELGKTLEAVDLTGREVQKMSQKKIIGTITRGYAAMPAFDKKLSKKEIKVLAEYVRSFKSK